MWQADQGVVSGPIKVLVLAGALMALWSPAEARQARSTQVVREFRQTHPCPSTARISGPCPGWQADHWFPLCAGGPDRPWALHWISVEEHKAKTRVDLVQCRLARGRK